MLAGRHAYLELMMGAETPGLYKNDDPRHHFYVVRCKQCDGWLEKCNMQPIKAERTANRHARRTSGHDAYVIDLNTLTVIHRYRFDELDTPPGGINEPPF